MHSPFSIESLRSFKFLSLSSTLCPLQCSTSDWVCMHEASLLLRINAPMHITHVHSDISRLKPIKELLPDAISYGEIHLTIAIIAVTTGFVRPPKTYPRQQQSPPFGSQPPSSSSYTPSPSLSRSVSQPSHSYGASGSSSSSSKSWGSSNWQKKGTKRKLPSSFKSSSYSSYGGKPKAKSKKFW